MSVSKTVSPGSNPVHPAIMYRNTPISKIETELYWHVRTSLVRISFGLKQWMKRYYQILHSELFISLDRKETEVELVVFKQAFKDIWIYGYMDR